MKRHNLVSVLPTALVLLLVSNVAFAQEATTSPDGLIGLGAGLAIGMAVLGGTLGQGFTARAALEGIARNPNAAGSIQTPMILGLALIESLVMIALLVAYLLQGKIA
jgi:F-type H+-transporting ATPase subunit c